MGKDAGKGSDPGSGVLNQVKHDGITAGVAVVSVMAMAIPVVGPFATGAGFIFLAGRSVYRGLKKKK